MSQGEQDPVSELFRSDKLVVRHVGGFSRDSCVVTFDSFTDDRRLERLGFGETFFRSRGIDAIHVIARENDWYQYAEMSEAMGAVHAATRGYGRVVTYGSSMGAYAAIRLAGLAGAHCALALSPQFSIDPEVAPFEYRWEEAGRCFRSVWEHTLPFPDLEQAYVVFDPDDLDAKHLELLQERFRFTPVRLRGAGHPVTGFLSELGLLEDIVQQVCRGPLNVAGLQATAWAGRRRAQQHFVVMATRAVRLETQIALLQEAVKLAPGNPDSLCRLGAKLGMAGRFEEARAAHEASLEIMPGQPNLLLHYSHTVERRGDVAGALALMEQAAANSGNSYLYRARVDWLRGRLEARPGPRRRWWRAGWPRLTGSARTHGPAAGR